MQTTQHKTATVNTRIPPQLKMQAEGILNELGLSSAEAIRLFYTQICLQHGLPFEVKIPNKATSAAMDDTASGNTLKAKSVDDLFNSTLD